MREKSSKNQRRVPRQTRSRAKYDAILSAATRVLLSEGYTRATTDRIALEADVSIGTLYEYFSSKEDIYHRYINARLLELMDQIAADAELWLGKESMWALSRRLTARSVDFFYAHRTIVNAIVREMPGVWESINIQHLSQRILQVIAQVSQVSVSVLEDPALIQTGKVLSHAVTGLIIRMVAIEQQAIQADVLKVEIDCLVRGYLKERLNLDLARL